MRTGDSGRSKSRIGFGKMIFMRRFSQMVFFVLFLIVFLKTDYNGTDGLDAAVNILFRLDPFVAACVMFGVKAFVALLWPSLKTIACLPY